MGKRSIQLLGMVLLLGAALVALAGFAGNTGSLSSESAPESASSEASAANDMKLLLQLGREFIDSDVRLTVKLQGEGQYSSRDQAASSAGQVAHALGLPPVSTTSAYGNEVFRTEGTLAGIPVQMDWALSPEGRSYVRVQLLADGEAEGDSLVLMQQRLRDELKKAGIDAAMNAAIQGYSNGREGAHDTMERLEGNIGRTLPMRLMENYEEGTTVSRSYEAPSLNAFVRSGDQPIHMQLAVHEDSMKNTSRITIGFPVITVEY